MSQAKLTLRPPPHLPFVQGFPGIPGSSTRPAAYIAGTVEVRLGHKGLKASWLRIELRKLESVPGGEHWGELIGRGPIDVWLAKGAGVNGGGALGYRSPRMASGGGHKKSGSVAGFFGGGSSNSNGDGTRQNADDDEEGWEVLQNADFPFRVMIPEGLPPSAKLDKQCEIAYELVTSLCVKTKKGLLRKESVSSIIQSTHPVVLEKHELHSLWPMYNCHDDHDITEDDVKLKVFRQRTGYGPGDQVNVRVVVLSNNVQPLKLKSISFSIKETVTFKGSNKFIKGGNADSRGASQRAEVITGKGRTLGKKIYKGDSQMYDLSATIPKSHSLMTISTAKHVEVSYTMRVCLELQKNSIVLDHLPMTMSNFTVEESRVLVEKIGYVVGLSDVDSSSSSGGGNAGPGGGAWDRASTIGGASFERPGSQLAYSASTSAGSDDFEQPMGAGPMQGGPGGQMGGGPSGTGMYQQPHMPQGGVGQSHPPSSSANRQQQQGKKGPLSRTMSMLSNITSISSPSSPGVAGRGVPQQIHSWGALGSAQPFPNGQPGAVFDTPGATQARPAMLMAPGQGALTPDEQRALFHHTQRAEAANVLGVDPNELSGSGGMNFYRVPNGGAPDHAGPPYNPGFVSASAFKRPGSESSPDRPDLNINTNVPSSSGSKIMQRLRRLSSSENKVQQSYPPRAGETGNQYPPRAGRRRSIDFFNNSSRNASSESLGYGQKTGTSDSGSISSAGPAGTSIASRTAEAEKTALFERAKQQADLNQRRAEEVRSGSSLSHNSVPTSSAQMAMPPASAEQEKHSLWQRARKQAEKYQAGFTKGAQFPKTELTPPATSNGFPSSSSAPIVPITATSNVAPSTSPPPAPAQSGPSSSLAGPSTSLAAGAGWISAAEEKERLYTRAREEAQHYQSGFNTGAFFPEREEDMGGPSASATLGAGEPTVPENSTSAAVGSSRADVAGSTSFPASESSFSNIDWSNSSNEKERLYHLANAQAQDHQTAYRAALEARDGAGQSSQHAATPSMSADAHQHMSAEDEKAQIKRFLEARDAVAQHQAGSQLQRNWTKKYSNYDSAPVPEYANTISDKDVDDEGDLVGGSGTAGSEAVPAIPALPASLRPGSSAGAFTGRAERSTTLTLNKPTMSEKEKLKAHYATLDAQSNAQDTQSAANAPPALPPAALSEKERLKQHFAQLDAQAAAAITPTPAYSQAAVLKPASAPTQPPAPFAPASSRPVSSVSPPSSAVPAGFASALSEKEQLKLYYAARDASEAGGDGEAPAPPPQAVSGRSLPPPPVAPAASAPAPALPGYTNTATARTSRPASQGSETSRPSTGSTARLAHVGLSTEPSKEVLAEPNDRRRSAEQAFEVMTPITDDGTEVHLPLGSHEGKQRARSPEVAPQLALPSLDFGNFGFDWGESSNERQSDLSAEKFKRQAERPISSSLQPARTSWGQRNTQPEEAAPRRSTDSRADPDAPEAVDYGSGTYMSTNGSIQGTGASIAENEAMADGGTINIALGGSGPDRSSFLFSPTTGGAFGRTGSIIRRGQRQPSVYDPKIAKNPWGIDEDDEEEEASIHIAQKAGLRPMGAPPPLPPKLARVN